MMTKKKKKKSGAGRPRFSRRSEVKDHTITLRVDRAQDDYLESARDIVSEQLKVPLTKTWVLMTLVEFGRDAFESKYGLKIKRSA